MINYFGGFANRNHRGNYSIASQKTRRKTYVKLLTEIKMWAMHRDCNEILKDKRERAKINSHN